MKINKDQKIAFIGAILRLIQQGKSPYKVQERMKISRQTIRNYLLELEENGIVETSGKTTRKKYSLKEYELDLEFPLNDNTEEHIIYEECEKYFGVGFNQNAKDKLEYIFNEMVNNAIDHSSADTLKINIKQDFFEVRVMLSDNGVGIFKKIMKDHELNTEKEAIFQLSKGKLTSDPSRHSGEGIFFSSRMSDFFIIHSFDEVFYSHKDRDAFHPGTEDLVKHDGTNVLFWINKLDKTPMGDIFEKYQDEFDGFSKTEIFISLAEKFSQSLMSRSIARRVLAGFTCFKEVTLDFKNVRSVGQGFLDEIFRVYGGKNPQINIKYVNQNEQIDKMLNHVFKRIEELKK